MNNKFYVYEWYDIDTNQVFMSVKDAENVLMILNNEIQNF